MHSTYTPPVHCNSDTGDSVVWCLCMVCALMGAVMFLKCQMYEKPRGGLSGPHAVNLVSAGGVAVLYRQAALHLLSHVVGTC